MIHLPALALAAPVMLYGFYRRIHRNIARQKVQAWRLLLRSGVLMTLLVALLLWPSFDPAMAAATLGGVIIGAPLALLGLRHTRFEMTTDGHYFTPNRILGVAISMLFIGRIIYRMIVLSPMIDAAQRNGTALSPLAFAAGTRSPLTLALLGVVIGYFTTYCLGVLLTSRRLPVAAAAVEPPA